MVDVLWLRNDDFDVQMALCMLGNTSISGDTTASSLDIAHHLVTQPADVCFTCKVLRRVKTRLDAGLRSHRFVQMSKRSEQRHRHWGVTAAFVLQVSTLREFCGLTETAVVSPRKYSEVSTSVDTEFSHREEEREVYCSNDDAVNRSAFATEHEDSVSCGSAVVVDGSSSPLDDSNNDIAVFQASARVVNARSSSHSEVTILGRTSIKSPIKVLDTAYAGSHCDAVIETGFKTLEDLKDALNDSRFGGIAHDSAIDSTGFLDSDSNDGISDTSSFRGLRRSTSQDSVGSVSSSVSTESWDMVIRNIRVTRSSSLDSIQSRVSSQADSALPSSEDERSSAESSYSNSDDSGSDSESNNDSVSDSDRENDSEGGSNTTESAGGRLNGMDDQHAVESGHTLYGVDERHLELLNVIRWTNFEDLLSVLRIHAEDEEYATAAGHRLCAIKEEEGPKNPCVTTQDRQREESISVTTQERRREETDSLQQTKSQAADIVEQAFLIAMASSEDEDNGSFEATSFTEGASPATVQDSSENAGTVSLIEQAFVIAMYASSEDESDSLNEDRQTLGTTVKKTKRLDKLYEENAQPGLSSPEESESGNEETDTEFFFVSGNSSDDILNIGAALGGHETRTREEQQLSSVFIKTLADYEDSDLATSSHNLNQIPGSSEKTVLEVTTKEKEQPQRETSSQPSPSAASVPFIEKCMQAFNFNLPLCEDSLDGYPTYSVHPRRLFSGDSVALVLPTSQKSDIHDFDDDCTVNDLASRSSLEDSNKTWMKCPSPVTKSDQWNVSDVFTTPVSHAVIDESSEASRWLEENSADCSKFSPFKMYGSCAPPHFQIDQSCERLLSDKLGLSFSGFLDHPMKLSGSSGQKPGLGADREEACSSRPRNDVDELFSSTPSLRLFTRKDFLDGVAGAVIDLNESEISFGLTERF